MMMRVVLISIVASCWLSLGAHAKDLEQDCVQARLLGSVDVRVNQFQWAHYGHTAYVINQAVGTDLYELLCIDLRDPTEPTILGLVELPEHASYFVGSPMATDGIVYLFTDEAVLPVDVHDPASPVLGDTYWFEHAYWPEVRTVIGDYMYVGASNQQHEIVNLSMPLSPILGSMGDSLPVIMGEINGYAYTSSGHGVDLSDPLNPVRFGPALTNARDGAFYDVIGTTLFLHGQGTAAIDLSDPLEPALISNSLDSPYYFFADRPYAMRSSLRIGMSDYPGALLIEDLSSRSDIPSSMIVGLDDDLYIKGLSFVDDVLWVLSNEAILAYEVSFRPVVSSQFTAGDANDLVLLDDYIAVACDGGYVEIFDNSDPNTISSVAVFELEEDAWGIDRKGDALYVANFRDDMKVFDISDPANPVLNATIDTGRRAVDVHVNGEYLYVVDRNEGLSIYDVSEPLLPVFISKTDTAGFARDVTIDAVNSIAYVASNQYDLHIFDIADPSLPVLIGLIDPLDSSPGITGGIETTTLAGNLLYASEATNGYRVFDVSDPANPVEVDHVIPTPEPGTGVYPDVGNFTHQIAFDGSRMYLANGSPGFVAYDNSDMLNPVQLDWIPVRSESQVVASSRRIQMRDGYVYTIANEGGLRVYIIDSCEACVADLNGDDTLDFFDVSGFLQAFMSEESVADFQSDGVFDFFDISGFLNAYAAGCP